MTVNGNSTYRKGEYFDKELSITNSSSAAWQSVSVIADLSGGKETNTGSVFLPKTPETFAYDADGNMTNDGRWIWTWDAENRLTQIESLASGPTASKRKLAWEYDQAGRRIRQTVYDGSGGSYVLTNDWKFLYDGWRCQAEVNATNNALVRSYLWGLDLSGTMGGAGGVGGLLAIKSVANGTHFYAYDGSGNVMGLYDPANTNWSARYEYEAFGQAVRASGSMAKENPFRFSTKRTDDTSDLVLYEFRAYIPSLGGWANRDPIAELGGPSLYGFVFNDPINGVDMLGLFDAQAWLKGIARCRTECRWQYTLGQLAGFEKGIKGLVPTVVSLVEQGIRHSSANPQLIANLRQDVQQLQATWAGAQRLAELYKKAGGWEALRQVAPELVDFLESDPQSPEFCKRLGQAEGQLDFEVVLNVLLALGTEGAGNALRIAGQATKKADDALHIVQAIERAERAAAKSAGQLGREG